MPKDVPPTSVVFCAPSKKADLSIWLGVGSRASLPASSPIHVVPTMARSGVLFAVTAVMNLSCAAFHGIAVTLTVSPGLAVSKSLISSGSLSPSAPMAHMVRLPLAAPVLTAAPVWAAAPPLSALRPQAVMVRAAAVMQATVIAVVRLIRCLTFSGCRVLLGMGGAVGGVGIGVG